MHIDEVKKCVGNTPHMNFAQALEITNVIIKHNFQHILELGFAHGGSTCYMAAALDELGRGSITTIDLMSAKKFQPNIEQLLGSLGLSKTVAVYYEPTSYVWRLMKMIEKDPTPRFDFCYIDGAHDWFSDGFAFYLVDKLLKKDGLIIFDDLDWSYDRSEALKKNDRVKNMPLEEKSTHQIRKVYELLVKTHPAYGRFMIKNGKAYAYKLFLDYSSNENKIRKEIIYQKKYIGLGSAILKIGRKIDVKT